MRLTAIIIEESDAEQVKSILGHYNFFHYLAGEGGGTVKIEERYPSKMNSVFLEEKKPKKTKAS